MQTGCSSRGQAGTQADIWAQSLLKKRIIFYLEANKDSVRIGSKSRLDLFNYFWIDFTPLVIHLFLSYKTPVLKDTGWEIKSNSVCCLKCPFFSPCLHRFDQILPHDPEVFQYRFNVGKSVHALSGHRGAAGGHLRRLEGGKTLNQNCTPQSRDGGSDLPKREGLPLYMKNKQQIHTSNIIREVVTPD